MAKIYLTAKKTLLLLQATPTEEGPGLLTDWYPGGVFVLFILAVWGVWGFSRRRKRKGE